MQPVPNQPGPLRVLVVDDVAMNRDIAGSFLRAAGHGVICVESGAEAVEMAAASDFDVILMDVRMPEMDGLEATRRVRALIGPRGRVPVIALTAQAFAQQVNECRQAGMDDHLSKPFTPDALLAAVACAVEIGRRRDRAERNAATACLSPGEASAAAETAPAPTVAPSASVVGAELPVLDPIAFESTTAFLTPEAVASYLQTIAERGTALLHGLRAPDALNDKVAGDLAAAAHTLAGSAGLFGFNRLATIARRFENAVQSSAPDVQALADGLGTATEATLQEIDNRVLAAT